MEKLEIVVIPICKNFDFRQVINALVGKGEKIIDENETEQYMNTNIKCLETMNFNFTTTMAFEKRMSIEKVMNEFFTEYIPKNFRVVVALSDSDPFPTVNMLTLRYLDDHHMIYDIISVPTISSGIYQVCDYSAERGLKNRRGCFQPEYDYLGLLYTTILPQGKSYDLYHFSMSDCSNPSSEIDLMTGNLTKISIENINTAYVIDKGEVHRLSFKTIPLFKQRLRDLDSLENELKQNKVDAAVVWIEKEEDLDLLRVWSPFSHMMQVLKIPFLICRIDSELIPEDRRSIMMTRWNRMGTWGGERKGSRNLGNILLHNIQDIQKSMDNCEPTKLPSKPKNIMLQEDKNLLEKLQGNISSYREFERGIQQLEKSFDSLRGTFDCPSVAEHFEEAIKNLEQIKLQKMSLLLQEVEDSLEKIL